jgi:hypothetical protein
MRARWSDAKGVQPPLLLRERTGEMQVPLRFSATKAARREYLRPEPSTSNDQSGGIKLGDLNVRIPLVAVFEVGSQRLFGEMFPSFCLPKQVPTLIGTVGGLLTIERSQCAVK